MEEEKEEIKDKSCHSCMHKMSLQQDTVCHVWCDEGERDFTFGASYEPCDNYKEIN